MEGAPQTPFGRRSTNPRSNNTSATFRPGSAGLQPGLLRASAAGLEPGAPRLPDLHQTPLPRSLKKNALTHVSEDCSAKGKNSTLLSQFEREFHLLQPHYFFTAETVNSLPLFGADKLHLFSRPISPCRYLFRVIVAHPLQCCIYLLQRRRSRSRSC